MTDRDTVIYDIDAHLATEAANDNADLECYINVFKDTYGFKPRAECEDFLALDDAGRAAEMARLQAVQAQDADFDKWCRKQDGEE